MFQTFPNIWYSLYIFIYLYNQSLIPHAFYTQIHTHTHTHTMYHSHSDYLVIVWLFTCIIPFMNITNSTVSLFFYKPLRKSHCVENILWLYILVFHSSWAMYVFVYPYKYKGRWGRFQCFICFKSNNFFCAYEELLKFVIFITINFYTYIHIKLNTDVITIYTHTHTHTILSLPCLYIYIYIYTDIRTQTYGFVCVCVCVCMYL